MKFIWSASRVGLLKLICLRESDLVVVSLLNSVIGKKKPSKLHGTKKFCRSNE